MTAYPKSMYLRRRGGEHSSRMYRNKRLTDSARGMPCHLHLHGSGMLMCAPKETVVWAHSNLMRHGKGKSLKAHDIYGCYACASCHFELDQGKRVKAAQKEEAFLLAMRKSHTRAVLEGALTPDDIEKALRLTGGFDLDHLKGLIE